MKESTIKKLNDFFEKNSIAKGKSSSLEQISKAEKRLGLKFDEDYIYFIQNYGSSMVGNIEIYGLGKNAEVMGDDNIIDLTTSYREDEDGDKNMLIIGTDYSGNSIGIDSDGKISVFDHDLGETFILAKSFEEYVLKGLEKQA